MQVTIPQSPTKYYSASELTEERLESYLIKNKIQHIGDYEELKKWYEKTNYLRRRAIEMTDAERVFRTRIVINLSDEERLINWHIQENKTGWFLYPDLFIKKSDTENLEISPIEYKRLINFAAKCQPPMKTYKGFLVPAYFIYDLTFDGMQYHHEWDRKIFDKKDLYKTMTPADYKQKAGGDNEN